MEKQYVSPSTYFAEITQADIDLWAENGAKADDRVLGQLLHMQQSSPKDRGVIINETVSATNLLGVHLELEDPDEITVRPFRACVGAAVGGEYKEIVTAFITSANIVPTLPTGDYRWDLIYAKVTIDDEVSGATVSTKVKAPTTGQVSTQSICHQYQHSGVVGVVEGTEESNTLPSIPADTATEFYIPLAYLRVQDTSFNSADLFEIARVLTIKPTHGGVECAPANQQYSPTGTVATAYPWDGADAVVKPEVYLPSTMVGKVERLIALDLLSATPSHADASVVDDSINWSNRIFKFTAAVSAAASGVGFAWYGDPAIAPFPNTETIHLGSDACMVGMGQSFQFDDGVALVAKLPAATAPNSGLAYDVYLYVDYSTGALHVTYTGGSPGARVFIWLEASGRYTAPTLNITPA